jgi:hypothetical protein
MRNSAGLGGYFATHGSSENPCQAPSIIIPLKLKKELGRTKGAGERREWQRRPLKIEAAGDDGCLDCLLDSVVLWVPRLNDPYGGA